MIDWLTSELVRCISLLMDSSSQSYLAYNKKSRLQSRNPLLALKVLQPYSSLALFPGLHMGAGKSKPKEPGARSMSLDGTIGTGSDSGHFHHLNPAQQTQTPNRSPAVGTGRRGHQGQHQHAPTNTPELVLFGGVDHTGTITSPQRGPLSGRQTD